MPVWDPIKKTEALINQLTFFLLYTYKIPLILKTFLSF